MAGTNLVAVDNGLTHLTYYYFAPSEGYSLPATQTVAAPPNGQIDTSFSQNFNLQTAAELLSPGATRTISHARSSSTNSQYQVHWKRWVLFCTQRQEDPYFPSGIHIVINFLQWARDEYALKYSSLNSARSALQLHVSVQGKSLNEFRLLHEFMKGVLREDPTLPRYSNVWDPALVLNLIAGWGLSHELSLKFLTWKLLLLFLLCSGQRIDTIFQFSTENLNYTPDGCSFTITKKLKRSKVGTLVQFKKYPADPRLCPLQHLTQYLHVTAAHRSSPQLFLSYQAPWGPVKKCSLSRWVLQVLTLAGVNVDIFRPHSTRAASTSGAARGGAQVDTILAAGGWTSASTFTNWYHRPVGPPSFQDSVFNAANLS